MKKEIMELVEKFQKMDLEDLRIVNHILVKTMKVKRNTQDSLEKLQFHIKQKVQMKEQYRGNAPYNKVGEIEKINPKKIIVNFKEHGRWNMLPSTLMVAK